FCRRRSAATSARIAGNSGRASAGNSWCAARRSCERQSHPGNGSTHRRRISRGTDFPDLTITRLGANTVFSFKQGSRELDLTSGAVLLQIPPKAPAVKVSTSAVTAAITGGTALFATGPPTKFMVLEGIGTFYPTGHPERAATINGGEMMTMTADRRMTKPEKFDVK